MTALSTFLCGASLRCALLVLSLVVHVVHGSFVLSSGKQHTCIVGRNASAALYCFGRGTFGQLGNGHIDNETVPTLVTGELLGTPVSAVSAGGDHSCAITVSGALYCFGDAAFGQLGYGNIQDKRVPTLVTLNESATSVSAGRQHTCIITAIATLYCFGLGTSGQLGYGDSENQLVPMLVAGLLQNVRVRAVSAGQFHTCAVAEVSGRLFCFGHGRSGRLGYGGEDDKLLPTPVAGLLSGKSVSAVSAASSHTCAIDAISSKLFCFGYGVYGQLGSNNLKALLPTEVAAPLQDVRVSAVSAGGFRTCAVAETTQALHCFGDGSDGRLGYGGTNATHVPTLVAGPLMGARVSLVSAGDLQTCAMVTSALFCFGTNFGLIPKNVALPAGADATTTQTTTIESITTTAAAQRSSTTSTDTTSTAVGGSAASAETATVPVVGGDVIPTVPESSGSAAWLVPVLVTVPLVVALLSIMCVFATHKRRRVGRRMHTAAGAPRARKASGHPAHVVGSRSGSRRASVKLSPRVRPPSAGAQQHATPIYGVLQLRAPAAADRVGGNAAVYDSISTPLGESGVMSDTYVQLSPSDLDIAPTSTTNGSDEYDRPGPMLTDQYATHFSVSSGTASENYDRVGPEDA